MKKKAKGNRRVRAEESQADEQNKAPSITTMNIFEEVEAEFAANKDALSAQLFAYRRAAEVVFH